ncbi:MAG: universal stress protein [Dehalococcoidia bacterium]|nr:universal stress protein [Dehalococcoidia bacterium]
MFKKILVPLDGSVGSERALKTAIDLGEKYDACLCVLSVEEHLPVYAATVGEVQEAKQEQDNYFKKIQDEATETAQSHGVSVEREILAGHAAETIVRYAGEGGFDLVVIGTHGHSLIRRFLLGGTAEKVAAHAPCGVLVVR